MIKKNSRIKKVLLIISAALLSAATLHAQESETTKFKGWHEASTIHFNFIYEDSARETVEAYALIADDAWNKIAKIYSIPQAKSNIYITDRTNTVNAFTYFTPPEIMMFTTPVTSSYFGFRENWKKLFFTHELIHLANGTFEDKNYIATKIFGEAARTIDYMNVPNWAIEGLATLLETELTNGGRGRSPYFELEFKAPALDNALISYTEIGKEEELPRGQAYIMGYLILRSIADNYGLEALADIERNRSFSDDWEDSVEKVTGKTAESIYRDVKIALTKKYMKERTIPEGIIVTPRETYSSYFKPLIIFDNQSFICLRATVEDSAEVVLFQPANEKGKDYADLTYNLEDIASEYTETILFDGVFQDQDAITSDENYTMYAVIGEQRNDRFPGTEVSFPIYKYTPSTGLVPFTKSNTTLFQPSVSRNGKTLVAVQQQGLNMALVQIDTETGNISTILKTSGVDYVAPSVNADGTKVAFLAADGTRAKVCVLNLEDKKLTEVANSTGTITDPAYPSWNKDGNLSWTSNDRGRLEVYEAVENAGHWTSKPVVSDPIGALWADKTEDKILYWTFASSGYVLKAKPLSEWGKVPDFNGPSMPGVIMGFNGLECDYPEFKPFQRELEYDKRSEETKETVKGYETTQTELSAEKKYIAFPKPIFYSPAVNFVEDNGKNKWGFGAMMLAVSPKLQLNPSLVATELIYYPTLNNFDGEFILELPAGPAQIELILSRILMRTKKVVKNDTFSEINVLSAGVTIPVYSRTKNFNLYDISLVAGGFGAVLREDENSFSVNANVNQKISAGFIGGLDYCTNIRDRNKNRTINRAGLYGLGAWEYGSRFGYGIEGEYNYEYRTEYFGYEAGFVARYTDLPSSSTVTFSRMTFLGKKLDCSYPLRITGEAGLILPQFIGGLDGKIFAESLISLGTNKDGSTPEASMLFKDELMGIVSGGLELGIYQNRTELAAGYSFTYDVVKQEWNWKNFYFTARLNWYRR